MLRLPSVERHQLAPAGAMSLRDTRTRAVTLRTIPLRGDELSRYSRTRRFLRPWQEPTGDALETRNELACAEGQSSRCRSCGSDRPLSWPVMKTSDAAVHPLAHGWISVAKTGVVETGAPNYDEFASDVEVTAAIEQRENSMLAVEMPHCTPEAVRAGESFAEALPAARRRLDGLKETGALRAVNDVVAPYRIRGVDGSVALGVFCMVDTDQISSSADEPGLVIRNEDVFMSKVRERVALTEQLGTLASAVLLLHNANSDNADHAEDSQLHAFLAGMITGLGKPAVSDSDRRGQVHEVWLLGPGLQRDRLIELTTTGELIVADGNHRSLAAQVGGLDRFLAVITTPQSVTIRAYHRLVRDLGTASFDNVVLQLADGGATVAEVTGRGQNMAPAKPGSVVLYASGRAVELRFSQGAGAADGVESMDHTRVEYELFNRVLGVDAGDKRITYVGGDYPESWLLGEVDAGREALAVLLAPVPVSDFIEVNSARGQLPRKSTWFTPKARAGLMLADVPDQP